jgi:thymidylate kinase/ADP-ribose pyrophosphatase YjhB (NUDIX family)
MNAQAIVQNLTDAEDCKNICLTVVLRQGPHVIEALIHGGLPGGQQQDDETAEEAAMRELRECGIDTSVEHLTAVDNQSIPTKVFYAIVDSATEAKAGKWIPVTNLTTLAPDQKRFVGMAVKRVYDPEALVREAIAESAERFAVHGLLATIAPRGKGGFLIALEGEDVRPHAQALADHLRERGLPHRVVNGNISLVAEAALQRAHVLRRLDPLTEAVIKAADALHRWEQQVKPALDANEHVIVEHWVDHDRKTCIQRGLEPELFEALFRFLPEPDAAFQISGESTQEIISRFSKLAENEPDVDPESFVADFVDEYPPELRYHNHGATWAVTYFKPTRPDDQTSVKTLAYIHQRVNGSWRLEDLAHPFDANTSAKRDLLNQVWPTKEEAGRAIWQAVRPPFPEHYA